MTHVGEERMADRTLLVECVHAATLAPSIYNSQPWRFRIGRGRIHVLADPLRALPAIDLDGREMHISLGAAVRNIEVVLTANGIRPHVSLFPNPAQPLLVARVTAGGEVTRGLRDVVMVSAVMRRRTARVPFEDRPLSSVQVGCLAEAAGVEGATLTVLDETEARGLLALVRSADTALRDDPAYRCELARWTSGWPGRQDGVSPDAFGPPSRAAALPMRDFGAYQPWAHREPEQYETRPTIAVLSTNGDGRENWLRAGIALERVLLEATIAGLSASFFTQPLEVAHLRRLYDEGRPHTASQMIFRLGYARQQGTAPSPRRPVADVLIDD
jgi:nitroreductase